MQLLLDTTVQQLEERFIVKCNSMQNCYQNINLDYRKTIQSNNKKYFNLFNDKISFIEKFMNELALEQAKILEGVVNKVNYTFDEHGFPQNPQAQNTTALETKIQALMNKVELMSFDQQETQTQLRSMFDTLTNQDKTSSTSPKTNSKEKFPLKVITRNSDRILFADESLQAKDLRTSVKSVVNLNNMNSGLLQ